jgi:hypothetical protein
MINLKPREKPDMNETAVARPELKNIELRQGVLPKDYEDVLRFAGLVHSAGLAPKGFDTAPRVAYGILMNLELKRPIITGLQDLAIINGRCGIYGNAALAMVTASGLMEDGFPKETETGTPFQDDWKFTFTVKRKGRPEKTGIWTWAESKRAGFDDPKTKDGKPDIWTPWVRFTRRMMQWKARTFVLRDEFGDILRGMNIAEDLHDVIDLDQTAPQTFQRPAQAPPPEAIDPETGEIKNLYEAKPPPAELSGTTDPTAKTTDPAGTSTTVSTPSQDEDDPSAGQRNLAANKVFNRIRGTRKRFAEHIKANLEIIRDDMSALERADLKTKWLRSAIEEVNGVKKDEPWPLDPPPEQPAAEAGGEDQGSGTEAPTAETNSQDNKAGAGDQKPTGQNGFVHCLKTDQRVPTELCDKCVDRQDCEETKHFLSEYKIFEDTLGGIVCRSVLREVAGVADPKKVPIAKFTDVLQELNAAVDQQNA